MAYVKLDMGRYIEGLPQEEGYFDTDSHKEATADIDSEIWKEKLEEFYQYLAWGELPVGVSCRTPKLSHKTARDVLWFLQTVTRVIPDNFDICGECGDLEDTDSMMWSELTGEHYCQDCLDYSKITWCEDCGTEVYRRRSFSEKDGMYLCKECRKEHRKKEHD